MLVNSIRRHISGATLPLSKVEPANTSATKPRNLLRRAVSHFFSRPKNKYDLFKRLLTSGIIGYALAKTPPLWVGTNNSLSYFGITPQANNYGLTSSFSKRLPYEEAFDNFAEHTDEFQKIHASIHQTGIDNLKLLDLNQSGIILDNDDEYKNLIDFLESNSSKIQDPHQLNSYEASIKLLKEYRELNKILWGPDGPKGENIHQVRDNCQIVTDIIGSCFTQENIQKLKSLVRVTDYNLDKNNFYINCLVNLNGIFVDVKYDELRRWRGLKPTKDAPEAPYIIAYAIEKELAKNHVPNSYAPSSAASTLLLKQDYNLIPIFALSDETLINIFRETPYRIIKVGSYPEFVDYYERISGYFTSERPTTEEEIESKIKPYHYYVVKSVRYKNNELLITVTTTNPDHQKYEEVDLTLNELRTNMITIAAPTDLIPYFDGKSIQAYLISLALLLLVRAGCMKLEKPGKKLEVK